MPRLPRYPSMFLSAVLAFASATSVSAMPTEPPARAEAAPVPVPVHVLCARVQPGMNYRDAVALIGREPDETLSGHTAAGPAGEPPGSYAIDFWYDTAADGRRLVSSLHYRGGTIESVDCGRPTDGPASPASPASPGT